MSGPEVQDRDAERLAQVHELLVSGTVGTGIDGAGVSLARGIEQLPLLGTDATAEALELTQFTIGEGPCVDAVKLGVPVLVADLENVQEGHSDRWPNFAEEALDLGVRAVFALPLRVGALSFGAADLYRLEPGPLEGERFSRTLTVVDAIASTVLGFGRDVDLAADLPPVLSLEVHRAAGMIMVQLDVSIDDALARLRSTAFAEGISVRELASDVINGSRRFRKEAQT